MKIISLLLILAIAASLLYAQSCNGRGSSAGVAGMLAMLVAGVLAFVLAGMWLFMLGRMR
jgi:hypothetical protein